MFMLKDSQGRKVVVKESPMGLFAQCEDHTLEPVDEAIVAITKNDDLLELVPDKEYCENAMRDAGFDPAMGEFRPEKTRYSGVFHVRMEERWKNAWSMMRAHLDEERVYTINGHVVDKPLYKKLQDVLTDLNSLNWIAAGSFQAQPWDRNRKDEGRADLGPQEVLSMIGVGGVVTAASLKKGCAKDETRFRLWLGDPVSVKIGKKTIKGRIVGLGKKVSVLRSDSKKGSYTYSNVTKLEGGVTWDEDALKNLDATLAANFKYVTEQTHRIYKAAITIRESVKFPAFPMPDDNERDSISRTDEPCCECPLCGWPMADFKKNGEFLCSFCRVRGIVAHQDLDAVTLLMLRQPAKNTFAIRESKCCGNCGLFNFEHGRQGKRSTGYCQATNQCVQAFSTCVSADGDEGYWFPRTPAEYSKQITQHMTNIGYSVRDSRNTGRHDIRDTIFRKEDLAAEKKRAEQARLVYAAAYSKFIDDLGKLADKRRAMTDEFSDEQKDGVRKHYQQVLSDGC